MSTEENKAVVRRYVEAFNKQNRAVVEELFAPNWVGYGPLPPPLRRDFSSDRAEVLRAMTVFWTAFPDVHDTIEHLVADGDKVVSRCTMRGTHQGEFMGIPPTGKEVSWTYMQMDRIEDGKFVESWVNVDDLGLLQQVGAIPQLAQTGA